MGYKPIRPTATTVGGGRTEGGKLIGSDGNTDSGSRSPESSCKIARRLWSEAWVDTGERRRGNTRQGSESVATVTVNVSELTAAAATVTLTGSKAYRLWWQRLRSAVNRRLWGYRHVERTSAIMTVLMATVIGLRVSRNWPWKATTGKYQRGADETIAPTEVGVGGVWSAVTQRSRRLLERWRRSSRQQRAAVAHGRRSWQASKFEPEFPTI